MGFGLRCLQVAKKDGQPDLEEVRYGRSGVDRVRWPGWLGSRIPRGGRRGHHLQRHRGHRRSAAGRVHHELIRREWRDRMELAKFRSGRPGSDSALGHSETGPGRRERPRPLSTPDFLAEGANKCQEPQVDAVQDGRG